MTRAADLEDLMRRDAMLLSRANRLFSMVSRTKKILYLGGAIAATAVGVSYLCNKAAEHAVSNTGCFVYLNENGTIRRCRTLGCSCPIPKKIDGDFGESGSYLDEDLRSRMRLRESDCDKVVDEHNDQPYYVHCDWNENDPDSVNYVDCEFLPDHAYVRCEHQDAFDALNEMIEGTVDSAWDVMNIVGKQARNVFASSVQALPWIFAAIGLVIIISIVMAIWRFWGRWQNDDGGDIGGHEYRDQNNNGSVDVTIAYIATERLDE